MPSAVGDEVAVRLEVSGADGCVATLLGPGLETYETQLADETGTVLMETTVPGGIAFVRAEVRHGDQPEDRMVALTNPIFLTPAG